MGGVVINYILLASKYGNLWIEYGGLCSLIVD